MTHLLYGLVRTGVREQGRSKTRKIQTRMLNFLFNAFKLSWKELLGITGPPAICMQKRKCACPSQEVELVQCLHTPTIHGSCIEKEKEGGKANLQLWLLR